MGLASDWVGVLNVARTVANEESSLNKDNDADMPSFSLGLTQDFDGNANEDALTITEHDSRMADQTANCKSIHTDPELVDCDQQVKFGGAEKMLKTYRSKGKRKVPDQRAKGVVEVGRLN
ncbi:hypothetical protein C2S53_009457 [Perilla frutescens var. hirtella]|uniref:Uncharacterized protein n=1 Tax=Perilla frutescens var. hirtella TaxID=608512 RepID=A0AAD4JCJ8_PERFH|nr:hypothetical protein C2S53_009457 [Perilla frutescens var. hirtella]